MSTNKEGSNVQLPKLDELIGSTVTQLPSRLQQGYLAAVEQAVQSQNRIHLARAGKSGRAKVRNEVATLVPSLDEGVLYTPRMISGMLDAHWKTGSVYGALEYIAASKDSDLYRVVLGISWHQKEKTGLINDIAYLRISPETTTPITEASVLAAVREKIRNFSAKEVDCSFTFNNGCSVIAHKSEITEKDEKRDAMRRTTLRVLFDVYRDSKPKQLEDYFGFRSVMNLEERGYLERRDLTATEEKKAHVGYITDHVIYVPEKVHWRKRTPSDGSIGMSFFDSIKEVVRKEESERIANLMGLIEDFVTEELQPIATLNGVPVIAYNPDRLRKQKGKTR